MIVVHGDQLVDANGIQNNPTVLIESGVIKKVGKKGSFKVPSNAEVVDATNCTLMPGLIDCHVHFSGSENPAIGINKEPFETRLIRAAIMQTRKLLDAGITAVMDTGGLVGLHVRNAKNSGIIDAPRIMAAGRYLSVTGGHGDTHYLPIDWVKEGRPFGWGMDGRIADGVDECMRAVREQLRMAVDFIKICTGGGGGSTIDPAWVPEYTYEEIKSMVHIAHSWKRRVMVHCYYPESIKRSITAGVDIITHGSMADSSSIKLMKENNTMIVPTMSVYERIRQNRSTSTTNVVYESLYDNILKLYEAGLVLAIGTDTMGGLFPFGGSAFELELYVEKVGLTPLEAIKIGTLNGAKVMGLDQKIGTIQEGKDADLIAISKDPLENISYLQDTDNIKVVISEGRIQKNII
jgi:imidazolonepropionase-like amidohydrolase